MKRKKFSGSVYMFINDYEDAVYRFDVVNGEVTDIWTRVCPGRENQITDPESRDEAMDCYMHGYRITKEQYDRYDSRLGLIACGLVENHVHADYDEEYYESERAKGRKLGY